LLFNDERPGRRITRRVCHRSPTRWSIAETDLNQDRFEIRIQIKSPQRARPGKSVLLSLLIVFNPDVELPIDLRGSYAWISLNHFYYRRRSREETDQYAIRDAVNDEWNP
jgi:hypothetical protein